MSSMLPAFHVAESGCLDYQEAKKRYQNSGIVPANFRQVDLDRGFVVTGLWSSSRHPNLAAEQSFWVMLYAWTCWITQTYINWTVVGAAAYLCLFQASTWLTELITANKYPEYKEYQNRIGKFLPRLFPPSSFSDQRAWTSEADSGEAVFGGRLTLQ